METDSKSQEWNGIFFVSVTLKELGLRKLLGHRVGEICLNRIPCSHKDFVVVGNHGIQEVALDYCGCETAVHPVKQLLRHRLFPATTSNPQTAATFTCLERFHLESFEGKLTVFEFYHSLRRGTDNSGVDPPKVGSSSLI